jgi:hypothetical protein
VGVEAHGRPLRQVQAHHLAFRHVPSAVDGENAVSLGGLDVPDPRSLDVPDPPQSRIRAHGMALRQRATSDNDRWTSPVGRDRGISWRPGHEQALGSLKAGVKRAQQSGPLCASCRPVASVGMPRSVDQWTRVAWLVEREFSASRKLERGRESPPLFHDALHELRSFGL